MGLENPSPPLLMNLNPLWPLGTDQKLQGDDHLRLIKGAIRNRFEDAGDDHLTILGNAGATQLLTLKGDGLHLGGITGPLIGNMVQTIWAAAGSYTWTKPAGIRFLEVGVQGGGGAGGGPAATVASQTAVGGGGGGGGYATALIAAGNLPSSVTVTVGPGGITFSGATGGSGGTSSFGSLVSATGGVGGSQSGPTGGNNAAPGGAGGTSGGTFTQYARNGQDGGVGLTNIPAAQIYMRGGGGSAFLGPGSHTNIGAANGGGEAGQSYGSGGSGAGQLASQGARPGTPGAAGLVWAREYY